MVKTNTKLFEFDTDVLRCVQTCVSPNVMSHGTKYQVPCVQAVNEYAAHRSTVYYNIPVTL